MASVPVVASIVPRAAGETTMFRAERRSTIFSSAPAAKATGLYSIGLYSTGRRKSLAETDEADERKDKDENDADDDSAGYAPPPPPPHGRAQRRATLKAAKHASFAAGISDEVNSFLDRIAKRGPSIMGEELVHSGSSNPRLSSPSITERKSTIKFSDNIQEQEEETPLLAPPQRPRSGSPYNDGHRNGSRVTITSPIDSKPGSPSTRPSPPTSAARSKLLYHGDGINRNVPIGFNLSRMLTSSLLNELQFARYEKLINIIVNKRGGMLPKGPHSQQQQQQQQPIKSAMKGSKDIVPQSSENAEIVARNQTTTKKKKKIKKCQRNDIIHIPVESQGISCGLYREGEARLGWRKIHVESWEQSREWASLVAAAEKKKAVLAEITGKIATGTAASNLARRKSSLSAGLTSSPTIERGLSIDYQAILNRNISSSAAASQTPKNGMYLQQTENLVKELGMYNSLSKFVSRPQLGKSKKLPGDLDFHITRAPPMGANGPNADKLYDISDFVIIRKVTANHYSTIRQATLASIPAVRRRPYALRTIIKNKLKTRALIETVRRERDIHAKLINRFIVQVLASFQTPKRLYVLLEWCPTTLDAIMGFQRVIKEDACRAVVAELVVALEYLHSNCIVHRGLEPTNLMLDAFGHVKISDFSTAITITDQDKQTADNKCLRLTRYSAPELILGERHGRCADWFSLGTIVYEMLTGNIPFGQGNVLDTLAAQYGGNNTRKRTKKATTLTTTTSTRPSATTRDSAATRGSTILKDRDSSTTRLSVPARDSTATGRERQQSVSTKRESSSNRFSNAVRMSLKKSRDPRRRSTKTDMENHHHHAEMVTKFADVVKAATAEEERIHFVAGIALTGNNVVQLPYLYRNISEHYNVTRPAEDFVRRCMDPDHTHRITTIRGIQDVKTHPWFRPLNLTWKELEDGKLKPPFVPGNEGDDQQIAEFLKNLNREETAAAASASTSKSSGGGNTKSGSVLGKPAGGGAGAGGGGGGGGGSGALADTGEDEEDVGVDDGVKDEVDPDLNESELQALIHSTFLHW